MLWRRNHLCRPTCGAPELELSIVLPIYNEAMQLFIPDCLLPVGCPGTRLRIIAVDDGSSDDSVAILRTLKSDEPHLRIVRFRRNFGQTAAFAAGFDLSRGRYVITMDADGQNDPADVAKMLKVAEEGDYDIVSGWRQERKESPVTTLAVDAGQPDHGRSTGVKLHDYGCSLKIYHHDVAKNVNLYGELHRFIPALASGLGVRVAEVPVNDRPRTFGKSKHNLSKTVRVIWIW